jgi:Rod binding domain-containing protein
MSAAFALPAPGLAALDALKAKASISAGKGTAAAASNLTPAQAKARAASQDFEAVFLNSMFTQMFAGVEGEGPMGGKGATGVWRSFLTDEYAKNFAKSGGIGIADQVYSTLLAQQQGAAR